MKSDSSKIEESDSDLRFESQSLTLRNSFLRFESLHHQPAGSCGSRVSARIALYEIPFILAYRL